MDGIPVFEGLLVSHTTKRGELVSVSSHFVPQPDQAAGTTPDRAAPRVTALDALILAAKNEGDVIAVTNIIPLGAPQGADRRQTFAAGLLKGNADAQLVWLPMNRDSLRLCWEVVLMSRARDEMFNVMVDARTGEILLRRGLTEHISNASYRVFTAPSPAPMTVGFPSNLAGAITITGLSSPTTDQPPQISQVLVITNALDANASPNGWIDDGNNTTTGNNVSAYLDVNADFRADIPPPTGSPSRVFDFPLDLTQNPSNYSNSTIVGLFYWNNWMHDRLYEFGFNEAAGNFQSNNFGRGGQGGDPVLAEGQFGYAIQGQNNQDNASFSTPSDGASPRMEMFIFTGPTPARDADFDTEVILHEYTHGLSNRRVGGGAGISALQSRGLGEGWSDFYSLALLSQSSDNVNASYPEGPYISYLLFGPGYNFMQNYYFGIRRYPYSTDLTRDPGTFKDIDPGQADPHSGVPLNPVAPASATEVHNQGEIWCAALWDARANLIANYGFTNGNQLMLQLTTDGMGLTPANPTFLQARDAIIQADLVDNSGVNYQALWQAFAKRGMGYSATSPANSTTSGVVEAYDVPDGLLVVPLANFNANGPIGGPFTPSSQIYTLYNTTTNPLNWSAAVSVPWAYLSASNGILPAAGSSTNVTMSLSAAAYELAVSNYVGGSLAFVNESDVVTQSLSLSLDVSQPQIYSFPLNSDPGWSRQGQWAFGTPLGEGGSAHGIPDPTSGATGTRVFGVNLSGDYSTSVGGPYYLTAGPLNFTGCYGVQLQFQRWLNSDQYPYVSSTISVSADNTNWTPIFTNNEAAITDDAWTQVNYGLAGVADNQPAVYVRWGYQVQPFAFAYSGWNIDDIQFLGASQLYVTVPASATEGAGLLAGQGQVAMPHSSASDLHVQLSSGNPAKVTVPATVTIPAGQTNVAFDLTILDTHVLDGTVPVSITASAPGDSNGVATINIYDSQSATLSVNLPANVSETAGTVAGTVAMNAVPPSDITVNLSSSAPGSLSVPVTVTIPSGQTNVAFNASVINMHQINGATAATVTAHVANWTDGTAMVTIQDPVNTNLTVTLPAQARESNGLLTNAGTVALGGTLTNNLVVSLVSSNTAKLTLPSTVTIPAGQTLAAFNVNLVSGNPPETPLVIGVSAGAPGYSSGGATMTVFDNQTPPVPFNPRPPNLSTTNPMTTRLSWSAGLGEGVEHAVNGGFETGDLTGWVIPGTNYGFTVDDGSTTPPSGDNAASFAGLYSAVSLQPAPAVSCMYQTFALPANAGIVTLSWVDRVHNAYLVYSTNQQFRVEVRDTNDNVLAVPYCTQPGDAPLATNWTTNSADLSTFAGQTVRVVFVAAAGFGFFEVHLDQVSLRCSPLPLPNYDVYFGTNASPGPGQFQGTTTNTFWRLSNAPPAFTTNYWQVVAHRANQTAGPVWQFSTLPSLSISPAIVVQNIFGYTNEVFNVTLSQTNNATVTVNYATADGTGVSPTNYLATNNTLSFAPGQTNQIINVAIPADTNSPYSVIFYVNLNNPVNAPIGVTQTTGTIVNPGAPPVINSVQISAGQVTLAWTSAPGKSYRVQYETNFNNSWSNVSGDVLASDYTASKTDSSGLVTRKFYRVVVLP